MFNASKHKELRQKLRGNLTHPEFVLWQAVRGKALGVKFRRQHGVGNYIVDFYAPEVGLIIELDGESHFSVQGIRADELRTRFLQDSGMTVVRFTNLQVMRDLPAVLMYLQNKIESLKVLL
ncbi:endonuclease domain-containing protein [Ewingella sp. S1.OA.A_B6]